MHGYLSDVAFWLACYFSEQTEGGAILDPEYAEEIAVSLSEISNTTITPNDVYENWKERR